MISIVIVQHNHAQLTRAAIESLARHHRSDYEIIVVDNGSTEPGAYKVTDGFASCSMIVNDRNLGFGAANNQGAQKARGEILLFLNNDTLVRRPILQDLETHFVRNSACGAAGPKVLNADGSIQYSTGKFPSIVSEWRMRRRLPLYPTTKNTQVDWVSGAALAVRREVFQKIDGFDERYFMYFEDIDLCRRVLAAGYAIHYLAETEVCHLGGGSQPGGLSPSMQIEYRRSEMLYYSLHVSRLQNVLLRLYLGGKFLSYYALGDKNQREAATRIIPALYRPLHAHRD